MPEATVSPIREEETRIRADLYVRLEEASLTRELNRQPPYHMSEIVEQAIEPWLAMTNSGDWCKCEPPPTIGRASCDKPLTELL